MSSRRTRAAVVAPILVALVSLSSTAAAQVSGPTPSKAAAEQQTAPAPVTATTPFVSRRWLDVQALQLSTRYRFIENSAGVTSSNTMQLQPQVRMRVKADSGGRYALHVGMFSGSSFTSSWNNTGVGMGDYAGDFAINSRDGGRHRRAAAGSGKRGSRAASHAPGRVGRRC